MCFGERQGREGLAVASDRVHAELKRNLLQRFEGGLV